jgi:hypothetical protein
MGKKRDALDKINSIQNEVVNSAKEMSETAGNDVIVTNAAAAVSTGIEVCKRVINGEYDNSDLTDRQIADAMLSTVMVVYAFSSLIDGLKPDAS